MTSCTKYVTTLNEYLLDFLLHNQELFSYLKVNSVDKILLLFTLKSLLLSRKQMFSWKPILLVSNRLLHPHWENVVDWCWLSYRLKDYYCSKCVSFSLWKNGHCCTIFISAGDVHFWSASYIWLQFNVRGSEDQRVTAERLSLFSCCCIWLFCNPMYCSPPGSPVPGIFQARILEWFAISSSRASSQSHDPTCVSCTGSWFSLLLSQTREAIWRIVKGCHCFLNYTLIIFSMKGL